MKIPKITEMLCVLFAAAFLAASCGASKNTGDGDLDGIDAEADQDASDWPDVPVEDEDRDCISDEHEGRSTGVDTDGDGTPDYRDDDSDGDTIPDSVEAGRTACAAEPRDSDGDGTPDFRDDDSDANGIPDSTEGAGDADSDGSPDFADDDNDADALDDALEIGGNPGDPVDFDGDTIPDYMDRDSDGDTIGDLHEQRAGSDVDTDGDTVPDRHDEDSDGDGWTDAEEAGDDNPDTPPVNTDGDDYYDFQDFDSDADGLSDALEREHGTSRTDGDSDDDGVNDLIEVGYGSDPLDPEDNPRAHGDFVFVVPYNDPADPPVPPLEPDPTMDTLVFSTDIRQADVFFAVDTTASMGGEIDNLVSSLSLDIIPAVETEIPDVWFGVGGFDDYPVGTYGEPGDRPFYLEQVMTPTTAEAQAAVERLTTHHGEDIPESHLSALTAIATGGGLDMYVEPQASCGAGEVGYPCFREHSIPIIVLITDAPFHNGPSGDNPYDAGVLGFSAPAYADTRDALNAVHAKVIGVNSGSSPAAVHLQQLATDTGTVDISGNTLVFQIASTGVGLGTQVVTAIRTLANQVPIDIATEPEDDASDFRCLDGAGEPAACCPGPAPCSGHSSVPVDAVLAFVDRIVPNLAGGVEDPENPGRICVGGLDVDNPADPTYFINVTPGTTVCFDIYALRNETVPAVSEPQLFRALIHVIGDMVTILDTRDVYFLVPPVIDRPVLG